MNKNFSSIMLSLICLSVSFGLLKGSEMEYSIRTLDQAIKITGLKQAISSTQLEEQSTQLGHAWNKYFALNINNNARIFGIYTDYDQNMNYSSIIGTEGQVPENTSSELITFVIPAGKYAVFSVKGLMPEAVQKFWANLWATISTFPFERTFKVDFELYDERYFTATPEVDIYISIK